MHRICKFLSGSTVRCWNFLRANRRKDLSAITDGRFVQANIGRGVDRRMTVEGHARASRWCVMHHDSALQVESIGLLLLDPIQGGFRDIREYRAGSHQQQQINRNHVAHSFVRDTWS